MDTHSRSYQVTINNPVEKEFTDDKIDQIIAKSRVTFAVHIYMLFPTPRRFSTLKRKFPGAHIEKTYGSPQDNIDYIRKQGKFADTGKAETSVEGSYREYGTLPSNLSLEFSDMEQVVELLKNGYSTAEIVQAFPKYGFKVNAIESLNQALLAEKYKETLRPVEVTVSFESIRQRISAASLLTIRTESGLTDINPRTFLSLRSLPARFRSKSSLSISISTRSCSRHVTQIRQHATPR